MENPWGWKVTIEVAAPGTRRFSEDALIKVAAAAGAMLGGGDERVGVGFTYVQDEPVEQVAT